MKLIKAALLVVFVPFLFMVAGTQMGGNWVGWAALAAAAYYVWAWRKNTPAFLAPDRFMAGVMVASCLRPSWRSYTKRIPGPTWRR